MKRLVAVLLTLSLAGCGYNTLQSQDEQVKAAWSEVVNQYQRRADLIPNLVATVKGFASQEQQVLLGVTNARAKVGSVQVTPETVNDPKALQQFAQAQGELTGALSRLLVVAETIRSSNRTRTSSSCRRSSKARKTASPSRATASSRRRSSTTPRCARSRPT
jgi:LemA protein